MKRCKECLQEKEAILVPNGTNNRLVDGQGRYWWGLKCPDCRPRKTNRRRTKVVREELEETYVSTPVKRLCRACSKKLPESRYFTHEKCQQIEYYDIFADYGLQRY